MTNTFTANKHRFDRLIIKKRFARKTGCLTALLLFLLTAALAGAATIDTGQHLCYDDRSVIACPRQGEPFFGQDAQYAGAAPNYRDNGDGTVSDLVSGLMWSKGLSGHKVTPDEGVTLAAKLSLGGYGDWRVPTIKELYSLIDFRGSTGSHGRNDFNRVPADAVPFINTDIFDFAYGDIKGGERYMDAQWLSASKYVSTTMGDMETVFGVNFADGRIKGYGYKKRGSERVVKTFYLRYVRGPAYGENVFVDNGDGTVTDLSTGLMWMQTDGGKGMNWQEALAYAENLKLAGHSDWRLPDAKELEYLVDYTRAPDTSGSPAIDPIFQTTAIVNEAGQKDYPFFWTSTTHQDGHNPASAAAYVAFGRAIGQLRGKTLDVHGAGAQRSDPKSGSPFLGHGPQGDAVRVQNYVRCVRGGTTTASDQPKADGNHYPAKIRLVTLEHDPGLVVGDQAGQLQHRREAGSSAGEADLQGPAANVPPQIGGRRGFVARLDRNGDGRVSRGEFDGPPDRFDLHDVNHDGYLTETEAPKGRPPGGARRPGY